MNRFVFDSFNIGSDKLYSRMFAKNYELSAKAYFDELLIVYDSDLEIYCFFERHI